MSDTFEDALAQLMHARGIVKARVRAHEFLVANPDLRRSSMPEQVLELWLGHPRERDEPHPTEATHGPVYAEAPAIGYLCDDSQFRLLRSIEKRLYGDGSHLTPDTRRDLANTLNTVLGQIEGHPVY